MAFTSTISATRKCSTCGSDLTLVKSWTEKLDGNKFMQTTTIYHCSNQACQDQKDKEEVKRKTLQDEKDQRAAERTKARGESKKIR